MLGNAAKFTPEGGEITVHSSSPANSDEIIVEVQDSGIGIEPEAVRKTFCPSEQGSPERARTHGGLGLELAISHAIVAAHGGQLTTESPGVGRGATFRVRLPQ